MSNLKRAIGDRVRALRCERGWSQDELSIKSDMHPSYLGRIERGEKSITIESLERVINALGISFSDFFKPIETDSIETETKVLSNIVRKLNKRSIQDQRLVAKLLDILFIWKDK